MQVAGFDGQNGFKFRVVVDSFAVSNNVLKSLSFGKVEYRSIDSVFEPNITDHVRVD